MSDISSRTPIACENCRRTKRKCAPPYPCHGCTKAEVDCVVRGKARPQRSAKSAQASVSPSTDQSRKATPNSGSLQITASVTVQVQGSITPSVLDACNVIRELVISETGDSAGALWLSNRENMTNLEQNSIECAISRSLCQSRCNPLRMRVTNSPPESRQRCQQFHWLTWKP